MSERNYSGEIATMIGAFLKADNWNYDFDKETGNFRFGLNTSSKLKSIEYYVRVNTDAYCVYAISPVGADVSNLEERAAMAEFLCRANYGMRYGNFEMDLQDGPPPLSITTPPASWPSSLTAPAQRKPLRCAVRRRDNRITVFSLRCTRCQTALEICIAQEEQGSIASAF